MDSAIMAYNTSLTPPDVPGSPPGLLESMDDQRRSLPEQLNSPSSVRGDPKLRALLQALPTRMDMEALVSRLSEGHPRDIQLVPKEVHSFSEIYYRRDIQGLAEKSYLPTGKGTELTSISCVLFTTPF